MVTETSEMAPKIIKRSQGLDRRAMKISRKINSQIVWG